MQDLVNRSLIVVGTILLQILKIFRASDWILKWWISTNLRFSGNWQFFNISSFHICWRSWLQISDISSSTLAGMLFDAIALYVLMFKIYFSTSLTLISINSKRRLKLRRYSRNNGQSSKIGKSGTCTWKLLKYTS